MRILFLFFAFFLIDSSYSRRLFGRQIDKYGSLGLPNTENLFSSYNKDIETHWFEQKLDHFDLTNTKTWKQRYFINEEYFNPNNKSPVFLTLGGEGEASPIWLKKGQTATNAKHFQAFQILLEHRYYGKSHPTNDMSTKNLKYLTSEQALQDTANFIDFIRNKYKLLDNKWIVFGGSYSGSLAAWFRLKYPHLVHGAVASSAPVEAILDFQDYIKVVEESLGSHCVKEIKAAINQLTQLLNSKSNWEIIEKKFRLCTPLDGSNSLDVSNLMGNIAGNIEEIVQYNKDNRNSQNITIDTICSIMTDFNSNQDPTDRLARVNKILLQSANCLEFRYEDFLKQMLVTDFEKSQLPAARLWTYQTCTEFGFFQSSDYPDHPFGNYFPVEFFIKQCIDLFGPEFNRKFIERGINFTNNFYGGFNLTLTNVIFPNGLIDPWHALGVLKQINPSARPLIIKETAHCADMYPDSERDPLSLRKAREIITQTIGKFLTK